MRNVQQKKEIVYISIQDQWTMASTMVAERRVELAYLQFENTT